MKNQVAVSLGRLAKGHKKNLSPAQRQALAERLVKVRYRGGRKIKPILKSDW